MKFLQAAGYFLCALGIYLTIPFLEYFLVWPLVEGLGMNYIVELLVVIFTLLVINPVIEFIILMAIPFKAQGLKKII